MDKNIKIIPLGGVRENGKNLFAIEVNDEKIFIFDSGLKYPQNEMLGIDYVIPDFTYLMENKDKVVGVFLTHGHSDAIGSLPYLLNKIDVPVFGSELTIELAKFNTKKNEQTKSFDDFHIIDSNSEIVFDDDKVSFFSTTHSIPDSMGIVLSTEFGEIVYTGDFKFDQTAKGDYKTDYGLLTDLGRKNVLALLSDSRNSESISGNSNEQEVTKYLSELFNYEKGRIITACVANNILRIQEIIDAAEIAGRKIYLNNKNLKDIINIALKNQKLTVSSENIFINDLRELEKLEKSEVVVLQTGETGEPIVSLQKMAAHKNKDINIEEGDTVLIATTPSYAMETKLAKTRDMIYRAGAEVITLSSEINVSGDASKTDLQLLINLLNPKYLIPVQGEYRLLQSHKELAMEVGIPKENIIIPTKGDIIEYNGKDMYLSGSVPAVDTMIDGIGIGDIGNIVLRDRKVLSEDGVFVSVVTIDRKKKKIVSSPKITSRGFIFVKSNKNLMNESSKIVEQAVKDNLENKEFDWGHLKQDVRDKLMSFLFDKTKRRPVILPVIMEVNQHHRRSRNNK
ncbi:RNase J family beta-CASP ribonuclease [Lactobacillus sp. S2-2]|uniref:ribonuclease J n=1 Tax=Lactobacillus sp. S2-2 TaxID=2692917 RepID=UPI001F3D9991|nr:ribonuclease J [Lactobacillus sp. S2-2]MCF6514895.1 RNase J family beta-CASP ribonuclease [Lactobacillus sp. S2-2]